MNTNTTRMRTYRFEAVSETRLPGGGRAMGRIEEDLSVDDHTTVNHDLIERWARHRTALALRRDRGLVEATEDMVDILRLTWSRVC